MNSHSSPASSSSSSSHSRQLSSQTPPSARQKPLNKISKSGDEPKRPENPPPPPPILPFHSSQSTPSSSSSSQPVTPSKDRKKEKDVKDVKESAKKTKSNLKPRRRPLNEKKSPSSESFQRAAHRLGSLLLGRQSREHEVANYENWKPTLNITVVNLCCEFIEIHAMDVGLFRIPGSAIAVKRIYQTFENPSTVSFAGETSSHNVAGAFKLWLRSLINPIIPFEMFDTILNATEKYREDDDLQVIHNILKLLPVENIAILSRLIRCMKKLSEYSEVNKMDAPNLAIVFGPTLIRTTPDKETPETIMYSQNKTEHFIMTLLQHYSTLFESK
eukprot:TRINITY_DN5324_c0_g1_i2.p1 TRINITY_DN5324_c0_g1~~TRINITY_DN5324_c0_g1_i2.p1  ORF type:complete len:330 (-),score=91.06 TRINITY_DN5324_c0_g1_i2:311-1300(-)